MRTQRNSARFLYDDSSLDGSTAKVYYFCSCICSLIYSAPGGSSYASESRGNGCNKYLFIFVEDNVAAAAKLTSGAAKSRLDGVLRQIEATGLKEPAKDKPRVKVTPVETQSVSADVIGYVYRIDSETPGIQPITAKLRLSKNGNTWSVSEFRVRSWIGT